MALISEGIGKVDRNQIEDILRSTDFFYEFEIETALDIADAWELYWIAVHHNSRHKKVGSALLKAVEEKVRDLGGKILWIETAGRPLYAPTEAFYKRNGYELAASLKDFYGPGDPKQVYVKVL